MRIGLVHMRTVLKNRIHATLAKYAVDVAEVSDIFGVTGRKLLQTRLEELPAYTRQLMETQLELLDQLEEHIEKCEEQIRAVVEFTPEMKL